MPLPPGFDRLAVSERIYEIFAAHMESERLRDDEEAGGYIRPDDGREAAEALTVQRILQVVIDELERVTPPPPATDDAAWQGAGDGG